MSDILEKLREATEYFISDPLAVRLIPEIRTNIVYVKEGGKGKQDVAAIPGRITVAFGRAYYCLPPAFGESDHMARFVVEAHSLDKTVRSAMNVKFLHTLKDHPETFYFDRSVELDPSKEGKTMNLMVRTAWEKRGRIPKYILDGGAHGKEPGTFILGNEPMEVVREALALARMI